MFLNCIVCLFLSIDLVDLLDSVQLQSKFKMPTDGIMPECLPILSNDELLAFMDTPNTWEGLVEPLSGRCPAQKLGKDFRYIRNYVPVSIGNEATRPKVLVCHDFAGNYGEDRRVVNVRNAILIQI